MTENTSGTESTAVTETPKYEPSQPQAVSQAVQPEAVSQAVVQTVQPQAVAQPIVSPPPMGNSLAFEQGGQMPPRNRKKTDPRRRKRIRRIIALSITAVVLAAGAFGIYELLRDKTVLFTHTAEAYIGSMSSTVYASGQTKAKKTEDVLVKAKSKISEVMVVMGQQVNAGDPLYSVDFTELQTDITAAEEALATAQDDLAAIIKSVGDLNITAPFSGKITDVAVKADDTVTVGQKLAVITDDKEMKLKQYFSYTYEGMIKKGMSVNVSIPSSMATVSGTVSDVVYVQRITPEGGKLFEAEITIQNPGTLTGGMLATCTITNSSGELMTPYESGELEFNRIADITAKVGGPVKSLDMRDYENVAGGKLLVSIEGDDLTASIKKAEKTVSDKQKVLDELISQQESGSVNATISGVVTSCMINPGDSVDIGYKAMTIADLTDMKIEAQVNEMDISLLKVGMYVMINQDSYEGTKQLSGTIEDISLTAAGEYGVSYFPVTIAVDNFDGSLKPGMSVWLEIIASQAENCVLVPNQAIKNMPDGSICVFIKADAPPENYIDPAQFGDVKIVPDGFYAVPVEVGMADAMNAEIRSGVNPGDVVFTGEDDQEESPDNGGMMNGGGVIRYG